VASRQVKALYMLLGIAASASAGAFVASRSIESPADAAARTAAPTPSPILVPIERRSLSSDVVVRGTARFGRPIPVSLPPSNLKPNPGRIATLPLRNAAISEGDVLLSASGRPVLVLAGRLPSFRDLGPSVAGPDVQQLEEALARLGFAPGEVDGRYDARTAAAVEALYRARGFDPFPATLEQRAALATLERDLADAQRARLAATTAAASAVEAVAAVRAAAEQLQSAASLESASRAPDRASIIEAGRAGGTLRVEAERARVDLTIAAAEAELRTRMAERATIALDPRQPPIARLQAEAQVEMARAARERAKMEGEQAIRLAAQEARLATDRVRLADSAQRAARLEGARLVRAALDATRLAEFDASLAIERAERLSVLLGEARQRMDTQLPADELVFIPTLPVRVEDVPVAVGAPAAGVVLSVTDNQLAVDSQLPLDVAPLIRRGMRVRIDERALGVRAGGVVELVDAAPGTRGVDGFHFYMEVRVDETPTRLEGLSVRLTIPVESTRGEVLAVPVTAVSLAADGSSRVQVARDGAFEYVTVTAGLAAGGFVEITPMSSSLEPGQMVVVGYKLAERSPPQ